MGAGGRGRGRGVVLRCMVERSRGSCGGFFSLDEDFFEFEGCEAPKRILISACEGSLR